MSRPRGECVKTKPPEPRSPHLFAIPVIPGAMFTPQNGTSCPTLVPDTTGTRIPTPIPTPTDLPTTTPPNSPPHSPTNIPPPPPSPLLTPMPKHTHPPSTSLSTRTPPPLCPHHRPRSRHSPHTHLHPHTHTHTHMHTQLLSLPPRHPRQRTCVHAQCLAHFRARNRTHTDSRTSNTLGARSR